MSEFIITGEQFERAVIAIQGQLDRPIDEVFIAGDKLPELVRCRDCKNFVADELGEVCGLFEFEIVDGSMADGFCAWGERRSE